MNNLPEDLDRLDYEIGLYARTVTFKVLKVFGHPGNWEVGLCETCGVPTVTIPSGEPTWCRVCIEEQA